MRKAMDSKPRADAEPDRWDTNVVKHDLTSELSNLRHSWKY